MSSKSQQSAERNLIKAEKEIASLKHKLMQEKESHKTTKEYNKSLKAKLSRRDLSQSSLKEELSTLKKTFDTVYTPCPHR